MRELTAISRLVHIVAHLDLPDLTQVFTQASKSGDGLYSSVKIYVGPVDVKAVADSCCAMIVFPLNEVVS